MIPIKRLNMLSFEDCGPRQRQCFYAIAGTAYWTEEAPATMFCAIVWWPLMGLIFTHLYCIHMRVCRPNICIVFGTLSRRSPRSCVSCTLYHNRNRAVGGPRWLATHSHHQLFRTIKPKRKCPEGRTMLFIFQASYSSLWRSACNMYTWLKCCVGYANSNCMVLKSHVQGKFPWSIVKWYEQHSKSRGFENHGQTMPFSNLKTMKEADEPSTVIVHGSTSSFYTLFLPLYHTTPYIPQNSLI
jgi:hypothetical protein